MKYINTTTTYTHSEKGDKYVILYVHKMKDPDTGDWLPCVTYKSITDGRVWTRSLKSFIENFEDINELAELYINSKVWNKQLSPL